MAIQKITVASSTDIEGLRNSVELAINRLVGQLNRDSVTPLDVNNQRIQNVAWPSQWHDAVNVEYLMSLLPKKKKIISTSGGTTLDTPGTITFTPYTPGYAQIGMRDITVTGHTDVVHVLVPYVDEPVTPRLWMQATGATGSTDPVTVSVTGTYTGTDTFGVGDFVIWNDTAGGSVRQYEVNQVTAISTSAGSISSVTLSRSPTADLNAYFGSQVSNHDAMKKIYKLNVNYFAVPTDFTGITSSTPLKNQKFTLPSACVPAVAAACGVADTVGTWKVVNASAIAYPAPGDSTNNPPAPGMRTLNGAEYVLPIPGALTLDEAMANWPYVPEAASVKVAAGNLRIAGVGAQLRTGILATNSGIAVSAYILYVEPRILGNEFNRRVAIVEQLDFSSGKYDSSSHLASDPWQRRTPYYLLWPCTEFPVIGTINQIFDPSTGLVRAGLNFDTVTGGVISFKEGGQIGLVITQVGTTTPGSELTGSLMT